MDHFSKRALGLTLALSGLWCASPQAQTRPKVAAKARKPVRGVPAPVPKSSLPLLLGGTLGGLMVGALVGRTLKKPQVVVEAGTSRAFDEASYPLAMVDAGERITRANAAWDGFFGVATAPGTPLPPLLHPDDLAPLRIKLQNLFDGEGDFSTETRFFRPDGQLVHAQFSAQSERLRKPKEAMVSLQDITRRALAERELLGAREAIRALYQVVAGDAQRSLDDKMKSLLAMGCGRFELPVGAFGRFGIDGGGRESFETLFVQSPDRRVRPALTFRVGEATSVEAQLLGLAAPPNVGNWRKHPFVAHNREVAYLGAPVGVEGKLFGMLSFADLAPREGGFSTGETELLQLMAQWIGGEIERDRARIALDAQQSQLRDANLKLEALATHDGLTGTKNRRAFDEKIAEEWSRATRYGTPLSLVLLDVDKFKLFNDSFGHQAGDEVLRRVARTVMTLVRTTDFFARYGGEEFALILPNTDMAGAMILSERLRARVEGQDWQDRPVTASFGVANVVPALKSAAELIAAADEALYRSKERGRNRVTHADELARADART